MNRPLTLRATPSSRTFIPLAHLSRYLLIPMVDPFTSLRGLANDIANDGITANAVLPGLTNTVATAPQSEEQKRATWEHQAIKRLGEPEDVTGAVLFLTSDDAAFVTGQAIVVDGGQYRIG
jgi:NAD(P)-dependent dehydrogenase (short-subunit alcohol dehydrogenase family)